MKTPHMKTIDMQAVPAADAYKILTGCVVPRPIAWVSTISANGVTNLAPYSFFTAASSNPPTVLFCPVTPADGRVKDTLRNIRETREFVVNMATEDMAEKMNATSAAFPPEISEFETVGLTPFAAAIVKPPRVMESPVHLECVLHDIVAVGEGAGGGHIVIGRIVMAHIAENAVDAGLHVDVSALRPISRLAGPGYAPVREAFTLKKPA